jgi:peptidoglycan/LPS O-acetylase OafA/YrhL
VNDAVPRPRLEARPAYRADIDGLRAVAVLSVVGFHLFPQWVRGGFVGVDIFFVISGFLISTLILQHVERDAFSFVDFYSRRVRRIFPALLLVLALSFAAGWLVLLPEEFEQLGKHIAGGAGFASNFVLWNESGYFDSAAATKPLLHLWSLAIEEQFYLVWPLLLWLPQKNRWALFAIVITVAALSFGLNLRAVHAERVAAFYSPQTRFWELMIGAALACALLFGPGLRGRTRDGVMALLSLLGATSVVAGVALITQEKPFPGWWALAPTLGAAFLIASGPRAWLNRNVLSNRGLVWIGLISYPLYLWHWALLSFAHILAGEFPSRGTRFTIAVASVLLAWFTYRLIEAPIRFGAHGRAKAVALAGVMAAVGLTGYGAYRAEGMAFRLPESLQQVQGDAWNRYARVGTCTLKTTQTEFGPECIEQQRPLVALWGDSHAGALYPGLLELQQGRHDFGIIQLNQAGCPPILDVTPEFKKECDAVNRKALAIVAGHHADVVIIHSAWMLPAFGVADETVLAAKVRRTLETVKAQAPAARVVVIGPVPRWDKPAYQSAILAWRNRLTRSFHSASDIPQTAIMLTSVDGMLRALCREVDVPYVSPIDIFCRGGTCVRQIGAGPTDLLAFDGQHFTKNGAIIFMKQIQGEIFAEHR